MLDTTLDISANLHVLTTPGCAKLGDACDIGPETYTASAMDAARHIR